MDLSVIAELPWLRSLKLYCKTRKGNVNDILSELTKSKQLEELEVNNVTIMDGNTIGLIQSFNKLRRLDVMTRNYAFSVSNKLPHFSTSKNFHSR